MEGNALVSSSPDARAKILDAAELLFANKGYSATTIKEIGVAAGQNSALLYYYFDSKETVHAEVLKRVVQQIEQEALSRIHGGSDPEVIIRGFVGAQGALMARKPHLPKLLIREMADWHGLHASGAIRHLSERMFSRLRDAIAAGQRAGQFRDDLDPAFSAISTVAQVAYFALARPLVTVLLDRGEQGITDADIEEFARHAAGFALSALRTLHPPTTAFGGPPDSNPSRASA